MKNLARSISELMAMLLMGFTPHCYCQTWSMFGPTPRNGHGAVFDPNSNSMIVAGGLTQPYGAAATPSMDVWLYAAVKSSDHDLSWTQLLPQGQTPAPRYAFSMGLNTSNDTAVLFGGATGTGGSLAPCLNDVQQLVYANGLGGTPAWVQPALAGGQPTARAQYAGFYDQSSDTFTVVGGTDCNGNFSNDVNTLRNATTGSPRWIKRAIQGTPPQPRAGWTAVYDSADNEAIFFGGYQESTFFNDVWILSNANGAAAGASTWRELAPSDGPPSPRFGHWSIYAGPATAEMYVSGGLSSSGLPLGDTWVLTHANGLGGAPTWSQLSVGGIEDPPRALSTAVFWANQNQVMQCCGEIYAGTRLWPYDNHVFLLTLSTGSVTHQGPRSRQALAMFYDSVNDLAVACFGDHTGFGPVNDCFSTPLGGFPSEAWEGISAPHPPLARYGVIGFGYNQTLNKLVVVGGNPGTGPCLNDVNWLTGANGLGSPSWSQPDVSGPTSIPARAFSASGYDSISDTLMVFGGTNCTGGFYNDYWLLENATQAPTWVLQATAGTPPPVREGASASYDPANNTLTVGFGDQGGKEYLGDVWVLSNANGLGGIPTWKQLNPAGTKPSARTGQWALPQLVNGSFYIGEGESKAGIQSDLWVLSDANGLGGTPAWSQTQAAGSIFPLYQAAAIMDADGNIYIFGGQVSPAVYFSTTNDNLFLGAGM
jgi:Galactose oxidase, central domain